MKLRCIRAHVYGTSRQVSEGEIWIVSDGVARDLLGTGNWERIRSPADNDPRRMHQAPPVTGPL